MDPENSVVDSKYSLVLIIALAMSYMLFGASAKAFGTLYAELLTYYGSGAGNTAWVGGIKTFVTMALGPVANHLCIVYSFRKVMFLGGILSSCGFILTSFMPRMEWMYLTYGLLNGIGNGFLFSTTLTVVNYYVKKRRAFATGFVSSGSGIGMFILPHLYRKLIDNYGIRGCFLVFGAIILHICVAASVVRQPHSLLQAKRHTQYSKYQHNFKNESLTKKTRDETLLDNSNNKVFETKSSRHIGLGFLDLSVFRIPSLSVLTVAFFLHLAGFTGILTMLPAHVIDTGYAKKDADLVISLSGIGEILSKILFGMLADKLSKEQRQQLLAMTFFLNGVSAMLVSFFEWYPVFIIYGLSFGIFSNAFFSLIPIVVIDIVGMERFPSTIGKLFFSFSLPMLISSPIAGWLKDATGSWLLSFRVDGSLSIIAGILIILNPLFAKYFTRHRPTVVKDTTKE